MCFSTFDHFSKKQGLGENLLYNGMIMTHISHYNTVH